MMASTAWRSEKLRENGVGHCTIKDVTVVADDGCRLAVTRRTELNVA
jgi:hypothetical protein